MDAEMSPNLFRAEKKGIYHPELISGSSRVEIGTCFWYTKTGTYVQPQTKGSIMKSFSKVVAISALSVGLMALSSCFAEKEEVDVFVDLNSFFGDFDRLWEKQPKDVVAAEGQSGLLFNKQLHGTLQKIREESRKMHQRATEALKVLHQSSTEELTRLQEEMSDGIQSSQALVTKFGSDIVQCKDFNQFTIKEFYNADNTTYSIQMTLPGVTQDNLKIKVSKHKDGNKTLVATAQPKKQQEQKKKVKADKKKVGKKDVVRCFSQQMQSVAIVDGRRRSVSFKDGELVLYADLPSGIDEDKYSMTFEQGALTVEFPCQKKNIEEKVLTFQSNATK